MSTESDLLQEILNELKRTSTNASSRSSSKASASSRKATLSLDPLENVSDAAAGLAGSMGMLKDGTFNVVDKFGDLANSTSSLKGTIAAVFGTGVIGALMGTVADTVDVYREFINVGQTFGGDMMNMSIIAADSSQSLETFAKAVKDGGSAVAAMGVQQFAALSGAIRDNIKVHGSYGMTIEEANGFLIDQAETQRILGTMDSMSRQAQTKSYNDLQKSTIALAGITNKARDQIIKMTMELQKAPELIGYMAGLPKEMRADVKQSVQQAMNVFASLPDDVAQKLGSGLTEGLALGSSYISESMGDMVALAPNVTSAMENVRKIAASGGDTTEASIQVVKNLQNMSESQMANLSQWASAGDASAKELLKMAGGVKGLRLEEMRRDADRKKLFGGAETEFMNFGQNMQHLWSMMKGGVMKFFHPVMKIFNKGMGDGAGLFDAFNKKIEKWSEKGGVFDRAGAAFASVVTDIINIFEKDGSIISNLLTYVFGSDDPANSQTSLWQRMLDYTLGNEGTVGKGISLWEYINRAVFGDNVNMQLSIFDRINMAVFGKDTTGTLWENIKIKLSDSFGEISPTLNSIATGLGITADVLGGIGTLLSYILTPIKLFGIGIMKVLDALGSALSWLGVDLGGEGLVSKYMDTLDSFNSSVNSSLVDAYSGSSPRYEEHNNRMAQNNEEITKVLANNTTDKDVPLKITELINLTKENNKLQQNQVESIRALILQDNVISESERKLMKNIGLKIEENG